MARREQCQQEAIDHGIQALVAVVREVYASLGGGGRRRRSGTLPNPRRDRL
jgi:hypothetical protein